MTLPAQIQALHALFIELTGRDLSLDAVGYRQAQWADWIRYGEGTEEKLRVVVAYVKRGIKDRTRHPGALKFQNLIVDWPRFADDYAEAMQQMRGMEALKRSVVDTGKAGALRATARSAEVDRPARNAGEIAAEALRNKEAWERLRKSIV